VSDARTHYKLAGIDKLKLFGILGYHPHSKEQLECHTHPARFKIPCCGRRWGKSLFGGMEFTANIFLPDTYWWICGPTYTLGEKEFRVIVNNIVRRLKLPVGGRTGIRVQNNVNQGNMRVEMPWNAILEVVSAQKPDTLVGEGLNGVIMSEAAKHSRSTWEMFIQPALSDRRGSAIFPSTPQGYNWYHGLFDLGQDYGKMNYKSWRLPSWTNTVMYPDGYADEEIQRMKDDMSEEYFAQEIAAEFVSFVGKIYVEWNEKHHVMNIDYNPLWRNFWAVDFGFTDPFCCYDIMVDSMDNVYVWREYQVSGMTTWQHCEILKVRDNPKSWHLDGIMADPRGADEVHTMMMFFGSGVAHNPVSWSLGIEAVKRWLKVSEETDRPKLFVDPSCVHLRRQMERLRRKEPKEEHNARTPATGQEGQVDYDDHGPDALRYFFNEFFVLGASSGLADLYDAAYRGSESQSFFTLHSGIKLDSHVGY
jgi:hypothetical protein